MDEKPKSLKEPILTTLGGSLIAVISITSAIFALLLFGHIYQAHGNIAEGRSIVFASFAINSQIYIFAYRSMRRPIFRSGPLSRNKPLVWAVIAGWTMTIVPFLVPGLRNLLGLVPLNRPEWGLVAGIAFSLLFIVEVGKWISLKVHARLQSWMSFKHLPVYREEL